MTPREQTPPRFLSIFGILHLGFGALVAGGATMEILNMLLPTLMPAIQDNVFMQLHHTQPVLGTWTVASNGVNVFIGLGFIAAGMGIFRRRPWVPRLSRVCAQALIGIALGGALVCAVYLYPPAFETMRSLDPALRLQGTIFLVSMIAAAVSLPIYPAIVWWTFSRPRVHAAFGL
jgi:hypothetical protein